MQKINQEFSLWTFSETETEDESGWSYTRKVIQAENNPDRTEDGRLMMSDSNRASRDCFFFFFIIYPQSLILQEKHWLFDDKGAQKRRQSERGREKGLK